MSNKSFKLFTQSLLLFCFILTVNTAEQDYVKIFHQIDPEAKCLDGSPATLYVHQGGEPDKFLIFFQGGGSCGEATLAKTTENCYQRSKTLLGSSKQWPKTIQGQGYISTDPAKSKFANWTKFIFIYCDGSLHQGNTQTPLKYKDAQLFFRGSRIVKAHLKWIQQKYQIYNSQSLVLTGCSAGAIASLFWTNYVLSKMKNPSALSTISDAGIFLNVKTQGGAAKVQNAMINLYKVANVNQKTPLEICNAFYYNQEWKCLFIQYGFSSIQGRILLIQSQYDQFAIQQHLQITCLKNGKSGSTMSACSVSQMKYIEKYRDQYMDFVSNYMHFQKNSIWTIACSNHCYASIDFYYDSNQQRIPATIGDSVKDAIEGFAIEKKRIADIDAQKWPGNHPCAY